MLSEILKNKKITTSRLSEMTGISKRTLEHYRAGTRQMNLINGLLIADALEIDPHDLINEARS